VTAVPIVGAPAVFPVRDGRLRLGRLRVAFDGHERVAVIAGFASTVAAG